MRKQEIANQLASDFRRPVREIVAIIDSLAEIIKNEVSSGDGEVTIRGFGTFTKKHRAVKQARDISRGEAVIVPEHDIPFFRPSKDFVKKML
jgi:DNA-binding protein HU-beta